MSDPDSENPQTLPEVITDAVTTVATGLPPQLQRSFWKAIGRVFRAGAEWPAAFLEGKAKLTASRAAVPIAKYEAAAADIRSEQEARAIINRESAAYAATHFADPALGARAVEYHAAHIIREQANRESVVQKAIEYIAQDPPSQDSAVEIDEDWLTAFLAEASTRSTDDFRGLFGRILAGEIKAPGSFSVGTIQSLGRLTQNTAELFQRACNLSLAIGDVKKIVDDPFGHAGANALAKFGLNYNQLVRLVEEGLVRPDFNEWSELSDVIFTHSVPFRIGGTQVLLKKASNAPDDFEWPEKLRVRGPAFTRAGDELSTIVSASVPEEYLKEMARWLQPKNLELYRITRAVGDQLFGEKIEQVSPAVEPATP